MKYLKRFSESWLPSLDKDEVDNILDKKVFSEEDLAYLNNYSNDNKEVISLLYKMVKLNHEIAKIGDKMNFWLDKEGVPKKFMDEWLEVSKKISAIENELRFKYKFDKYPEYLRKLETELGLTFKQSKSLGDLTKEQRKKLFSKWDELLDKGMSKEEICEYLQSNYMYII